MVHVRFLPLFVDLFFLQCIYLLMYSMSLVTLNNEDNLLRLLVPIFVLHDVMCPRQNKFVYCSSFLLFLTWDRSEKNTQKKVCTLKKSCNLNICVKEDNLQSFKRLVLFILYTKGNMVVYLFFVGASK